MPDRGRWQDLQLPHLNGQQLAGGAGVIALLLLYAPVFGHAIEVWRTDAEFSFGFLAPPLVLGLLWQRRAALVASLGPGRNAGLPALFAGLLLYLAGIRSDVHAVSAVSFLPAMLGVAAFLYGSRTARLLSFPVAYLTAGLCLYRGLLNPVGFALQGMTARGAALLVPLFGLPVRRDGVDLFAGHYHFVVAEACSGMSSLLALLCLGALMVGLAQASLSRRALLIALILPIVLAANVIRVTLVLLLSRPFGLAAATGLAHNLLGAALFLSAFGLFFVAGSMLGCYPQSAATP